KVPGKTYQVAIHADPEHFLDWDKPLSQQSEKVRQGIEKAYGKPLDQLDQSARGSSLHALVGHGDAVKAATALRQAGVPGIKYLDRGSRAAEAGSRNYVAFDDRFVEITAKFGLAAALTVGATKRSPKTEQ